MLIALKHGDGFLAFLYLFIFKEDGLIAFKYQIELIALNMEISLLPSNNKFCSYRLKTWRWAYSLYFEMRWADSLKT